MLRRFLDFFSSNLVTGSPQESDFLDIHLDLHVTQEQIDASEVVPLEVPELGIVEIKLPRETQDGFIIRLSGALPNKGSVLAHIRVVAL